MTGPAPITICEAPAGRGPATLWATAAPATWNQRRAALGSFLTWCGKNSYPAPALPASVERQPEQRDETRAIDRAAIQRLLTRRDIPLREKTLWRMLYETTARAAELLALDIENLELHARRARVVSKGGDTEYEYWASGTARLLPRLIRGRERGPVFLSERKPGPDRRPPTADPRHLPAHRPGQARLRPRPGPARPVHPHEDLARLGPAPAAALRRHPPRRGQRWPPTDHSQGPLAQPPHRNALRRARHRRPGRSHRTTRHHPTPPQLTAHQARALTDSGSHRAGSNAIAAQPRSADLCWKVPGRALTSMSVDSSANATGPPEAYPTKISPGLPEPRPEGSRRKVAGRCDPSRVTVTLGELRTGDRRRTSTCRRADGVRPRRSRRVGRPGSRSGRCRRPGGSRCRPGPGHRAAANSAARR